MLVRSYHFPGKTFFNHSVNSARMESYRSIYKLYRENNHTPSIVVLGLDSWIFDRDDMQPKGWLSLRLKFLEIAKRLGIDPDLYFDPILSTNSSKLLQLFSLQYLQEIVNIVTRKMNSRKIGDYFATNEINHPLGGKRSDGSHVYTAEVVNKPQEMVDLAAIPRAKKTLTGCKYHEIDPNLAGFLRKFIGFLKSKQIEIFLFLTPYHPLTYKLISQANLPECVTYNEVEAYIQKMAKEFNIAVIGSYDPAISQCSSHEFYDSIHPKQSCIDRIFSNVTVSP